MRTFFPEIEPYQQDMLRVSPIHEIYYEQSGNPQGTPVIFVHGGPGGGCDPLYRRFFDAETYRIILFDQRGSGKSQPFASLEENTTWDLVADMEKLREHLGIETWVVFGGSWGSTLSLAYAETHANRVRALVLRGIFLCRPKEIKWFYQEGANAIYPDVWEDYYNAIPPEERHDMITAYYKRLTSEDKEVRLAAAKAWSIWEGSTSKLIPSDSLIKNFGEPEKALPLARIECHYFVNNAFFDSENYLIENVGKIRHIPAVIVQGRYDIVCPIMSAWELHKAWPEAKLEIIGDAGHSATEPGIVDGLVRATDSFKHLK